MKTIKDHFSNWAIEYAWSPLAFLIVYLMIKFAHSLTGRPPTESADFLVQLGFRLMACIFVIILLSLAREATGVWFTKDEIKENWALAWPPCISKICLAAIFMFALLH